MTSSSAATSYRFSVSFGSRRCSGDSDASASRRSKARIASAEAAATAVLGAQVPELRRDVRGVRAAQADRPLVVVEVVAPLGQPEARLAEIREVDGGVLEVGLDADPEQRARAVAMEVEVQGPEVVDRADRVDPVEERPQRLGAGRRDRGLVHAGRVEVAGEAGDGIGVRPGGRGTLEQPACQLLVVVVELEVRAPHRVLGGTGFAASQRALTWW